MTKILTGIDIVYIPGFKESLSKGGDAFINRVFCGEEVLVVNPESLAGIWAAKEAFFKASGEHLQLYEVEVRKTTEGRPYLHIPDPINKKYQSLDISISHDHDYAIAICILEL